MLVSHCGFHWLHSLLLQSSFCQVVKMMSSSNPCFSSFQLSCDVTLKALLYDNLEASQMEACPRESELSWITLRLGIGAALLSSVYLEC